MSRRPIDEPASPDVRRRREQLLARFEDITDVPLLLAALALIPVLVLPVTIDIHGPWRTALSATEWAIWAMFVAEYLVRLTLTDLRWRFIRREWPDLLIILLPMLRPLRIARSAHALRLLHLGRLAAVLVELTDDLRNFLVRRHLQYVLALSTLITLGAASLTFAFEADAGGTITSFPTALWWAMTTVTTVGYGDTYPVTVPGRITASVLMVTGVAVFGVLLANLAAFMLDRGRKDDVVTAADVSALHERLDRLEQLLADLAASGPGKQ